MADIDGPKGAQESVSLSKDEIISHGKREWAGCTFVAFAFICVVLQFVFTQYVWIPWLAIFFLVLHLSFEKSKFYLIVTAMAIVVELFIFYYLATM